MANWPRTILPQSSTPPRQPSGMISFGQTGKAQTRATLTAGRQWDESYPPFLASTTNARAFLAFINACWRNAARFNVSHLGIALLGAGGGTPLVKGAGQIGSSLATDGWPNSTAILKSGDFITVTGLALALEVQSDVSSDGSGNATLILDPPIMSALADNAAIVTTGIVLQALIASMDIGTIGADGYCRGLKVTFQETP